MQSRQAPAARTAKSCSIMSGGTGRPNCTCADPPGISDFWRRAWVNNVSFLSKNFPQAFRISQDRGEGMIIHGTRQWTNYRVAADVTVHLADYAGVAVRVQGLRRYYAILLIRPNLVRVVKAYDGATTTLAETAFDWAFETAYQFEIEVEGRRIGCKIGATELSAHDYDPRALDDGGIASASFAKALRPRTTSGCRRFSIEPLPKRTLGDGATMRPPVASGRGLRRI